MLIVEYQKEDLDSLRTTDTGHLYLYAEQGHLSMNNSRANVHGHILSKTTPQLQVKLFRFG